MHKNDWFRRRMDDAEVATEIVAHSAALDFADQFVSIMEATGVRKVDLARRMGRSRSFVTKVLSGDQNLTIRTMALLAWAVGHDLGFTFEPATRPFDRICDGAYQSAPVLVAWYSHGAAIQDSATDSGGWDLESAESCAGLSTSGGEDCTEDMAA